MIIKCRCGCGQEFKPSRATLSRIKQGMDVGYLSGHAHKGARNGRWQGGYTISDQGYKLILRPDHPNARETGYILEHRFVMSEFLGRPLMDNEVVHHINGDKQDNRIENLELLSKSDHTALHMAGEKNPNWKENAPKLCPQCKCRFIKANRGNHARDTYCSRACMRLSMVGENAAGAKLSNEQVSQIRSFLGKMSHRKIAILFGVSKTQVGRILRNQCR